MPRGRYGWPTMAALNRSMNASTTLSPVSQKVRRRSSARRPHPRPPVVPSQESHDAALATIRTFLKSRTAYDAFPVSFRLIVLDAKLEVKKALQCLLHNGSAA
jgi:5'-AMP-activated protein kinase, regulatory gamma subunit